MTWLGDFPEDFTAVVCMFTTHDGNGAPVAPLTAFEAADVRIYKNGVNTEKTTTNGVTMTSPFDSITGLHCLVIDTSNDTGDSGFWTTGGGGHYTLVLSPDTETVNGQTVAKVIGQFGIALSPALRPTVAGRTLDVSSTGEAGVDWANVGSPTTTVGLSGTTIATSQVVASVSGAVGSVTGAVGSVTGAVGSVTGNVGGSVASVTARVTANTDQWAGGTIPSPNVTGVPIIDLKYILGTVLTETAGQIAAAFKKVFDVATPVFTATSVNQTGDAYSKLTATRAEPGQGAPAATTDPLTKLDYLFKAFRNRRDQTATTFSLYNDAGDTVDQKATVSDDNTTATRGKVGSGP